MIPAEDAERYYSKRQRQALAMAQAAADPGVRSIHLEMARRYALLAGEGHGVLTVVLNPPADLIPEQLPMRLKARS